MFHWGICMLTLVCLIPFDSMKSVLLATQTTSRFKMHLHWSKLRMLRSYFLFLQETAQRTCATDVVQFIAIPAPFDVGISGWRQTDTQWLCLYYCSYIVTLSYPSIIYVDVNGGHLTIFNICQDSGYIHYKIYVEDCCTCLG